MKARHMLVLSLAVGVALAVVISASGNRRAIAPIPAFTPAESLATPMDDWIAPHGNVWNQRYSGLTEVNKSNVKQLKIAWHSRVWVPTTTKPNFTGLSAEASPVSYKGTVYMPDSKANVYALDAGTGERQWLYKPKWPKGYAPALATRGVALGDGKVFYNQPDAVTIALDQSTGRLKWKHVVGDYKKGYFFTAPPQYWNGVLYLGTSGGDFGARCKIVALDAKTGKQLWSFFLIPLKKGELGFETWPAKKAWNGGGAVWNTPTIDPKLGLMYINTGNPVPYTGITRGPGQELFTDAIVALHLKTGKYAWHFQTVHHDIWDYDIPQSNLLFDLPIKGQMRHGLALASKTGWVYILDRRTGKPLIGINEKAVPQLASAHTYPTQPIPVGQPFSKQCPNTADWAKLTAPDGKPYRIGCIFTPYDEKQWLAFAPAALGGTDWPPSAYSPRTGYMYVCGKDSQAAWRSVPETQAMKLKPLGNFFQVEGLYPAKGSPAKKTVGTLTAMNMRNNRVVWQARWPADMCYSGVMTTAGGLVFVGRSDGRFQAYDEKTGNLLWQSKKLLAGVNAAPISFRTNGKQYIAVYAGGNGLTSSFSTGKVRYGSDLYAFALPS